MLFVDQLRRAPKVAGEENLVGEEVQRELELRQRT